MRQRAATETLHRFEGGACDDRNRAAEGLLTWCAGPVALPEPRRRPRTLLLALLAGLSCAFVSCVAYMYVQ
eukprot:3059846-Prymnesium_polylepis.1